MEIKTIKNILKKTLKCNDIHIDNNGKYFKIFVISDIFIKLNRIQREQIVYQPLKLYIKNNDIHAISVYTYTLKEWEIEKNTHPKKK